MYSYCFDSEQRLTRDLRVRLLMLLLLLLLLLLHKQEEALWHSGCAGHIAVAQYLLDTGAEWPADFIGSQKSGEGPITHWTKLLQQSAQW
jgi:hypothetical protein